MGRAPVIWNQFASCVNKEREYQLQIYWEHGELDHCTDMRNQRFSIDVDGRETFLCVSQMG